MYRHPSLNLLAGSFIAAGIILLLENFDIVSGISRLWPVLLLVLGLGFVLLFREQRAMDIVLLWFGTFLLCLGVFFQYLNLAGWGRMAHLWPVFLLIVAVCFLTTSTFTAKRTLFTYLAIIFTMLFGSLYLVFGVSLLLWPASLLVFGLSLLSINYADRWQGRRQPKEVADVTDSPVH